MYVKGLVQDVTNEAEKYKGHFSGAYGQMSVGGKVVGLPQDTGPLVYVYNEAEFKKLGIGVPKTSSELLSSAKKAAAKGKYILGFEPDEAQNWLSAQAAAAGAVWYSAEGDKWKVEAGLKSIFRLGATESVFKVLDKISNEWVVGSLFGQHLGISGSPMAYKQNIYGAYGNVTYLKGKVSLVAGARAEYGVQNVEFAKEPKANLHHTFLDVVPQLIATWTLADADQLKLGYNYRIQRPSITQLNPYREQVSPLLVKYGNENLSNERVHALDATYSHYTQKFSLMLSASYQFSNNKVEEYFFSQLDDKGNRILHQTYTDKGKMRSLGFNIFTQYVPASWIRLYLQSNLNFVTLDASGIKINGKDDYGNTVMKGLGGNSFVGATFTLPKNWSLGVNAGVFIQPPTINLKSFWGSWHHLSVSKSFLKQRLSLSGWISNPFSPWYDLRIAMSSPSFTGEAHVRNYALSTGISISYSFGNLKNSIRKVSRTIENKDLMSSEKKQGVGGAPGGVGGN